MRKAILSITALLACVATFASSNGGVRAMQPTRVPVIMAQFSDVQFKAESTVASFGEFFSGADYKYGGATGSVQKYFKDQSFGQYIPQFDVIGIVTLSGTQKYYGDNDYYDNDLRADEMVAEACNLAEDLADFTPYDTDGDGKLDAIVIVYAGEGEIYGVRNFDAVWAYTSNLEESDEIDYYVEIDGKRVANFTAVPELQSSAYRDGIGTFIHEFAHVLGLPNFCTTDGGKQKTLGDWDVMDHGSYNNNSRTPAAMSAYERFYLGWVEPILLDGPMNVRLRDLNKTGDCAIITAGGQHNLNGLSPDPTEFYILENRQQEGWDAYLPGHGLMLTKIDFVKNKWESDEVNNVERHPCVDMIEAGGGHPEYDANNLTNGYFGNQKDLFPAGATEYKMFSNKMFFENVKEQDGVIFFDFNGGVEKCKVSFYAGSNGSCETKSLTEKSKGAGVVLPNVTAAKSYTFLGWATRKNSTTPDAGKAGETFYPMSNCTLFAVYHSDENILIDYTLKGVFWDEGNATAYVKRNKDFYISFKAKEGYLTPAASTCQVRVICGDKQVPNYTFENDAVVVRFKATDVPADVDNISITIINVREQKEAGCDTYKHLFESSCYPGSAQDFSGYDWNVTIANDNTCAYDDNKGATFGSGSYPAGKVSLYTEETFGCAVATVRVQAAANGDGLLSVYVAGNQVGETEYLETSLEEYTFDVANPQSGAVEIRLENTQKAMYLKRIEMEFVKLEVPVDDPTSVESNVFESQLGKKMLLNGQLFIMHNGHYYNVLGARVK